MLSVICFVTTPMKAKSSTCGFNLFHNKAMGRIRSISSIFNYVSWNNLRLKSQSSRDRTDLIWFLEEIKPVWHWGKKVPYTVKVWDDLVEKAQAFDASIIDALLCVKVREVGDRSEHDSDLVIWLAVQLLEQNGSLVWTEKTSDSHSELRMCYQWASYLVPFLGS